MWLFVGFEGGKTDTLWTVLAMSHIISGKQSMPIVSEVKEIQIK